MSINHEITTISQSLQYPIVATQNTMLNVSWHRISFTVIEQWLKSFSAQESIPNWQLPAAGEKFDNLHDFFSKIEHVSSNCTSHFKMLRKFIIVLYIELLNCNCPPQANFESFQFLIEFGGLFQQSIKKNCPRAVLSGITPCFLVLRETPF